MHFRRCRIYIDVRGTCREHGVRQRDTHDPREREFELESHVAGLRPRMALTF